MNHIKKRGDKMNWYDFNEREKKEQYYIDLSRFVDSEYEKNAYFPPRGQILNALNLTPYDMVKVVILGQDPYHGEHQAMGLSFSVPKGVTIPPSLKNIYKELNTEYGDSFPIPESGDLTPWAKQGVLLLNSVLTVHAHQPASHAGHGWETYTDRILTEINNKTSPVVFLLWGRYAREKKHLITNPIHCILEAPHPSPYSAGMGFFGCNHFRKCNEFLKNNNMVPINWNTIS